MALSLVKSSSWSNQTTTKESLILSSTHSSTICSDPIEGCPRRNVDVYFSRCSFTLGRHVESNKGNDWLFIHLIVVVEKHHYQCPHDLMSHGQAMNSKCSSLCMASRYSRQEPLCIAVSPNGVSSRNATANHAPYHCFFIALPCLALAHDVTIQARR